MAVLLAETFEGGTNGSNCTTGNTGFTTVNLPAVFTNSLPKAGTLCCEINASASTGVLRYDPGSTRSLGWMRYYYKMTAAPAATTSIGVVFNGATKVAELRLLTTGALQIRDNNTVVATSTNLLTAGVWSRFGWKVDPVNGQIFNLYLGANFEAAVGGQDEQLTGTASGTSQTTVDSFRLGVTTSSTLDAFLDDVSIDDAVEPGPTNPVVSTYSTNWQLVFG